MLHPLFDRNAKLVAWISPDKHIFDLNMRWVAFICNGHAWSSNSGNWLCPVNGCVCLDTTGKVFAWNPSSRIAGTARPARPARPCRPCTPCTPCRPCTPCTPARPCTPINGWSNYSFEQWLNQ